MTASVIGRRVWGGAREDDGHRTWDLVSYVRCTSKLDGPAVVMQCGSLPQIGDTWNFGNDVDVWAFCYPNMKIQPLPGANPGENEPFVDWMVSQKFSTRPLKRCSTTQIEDPINEPYIISGTFLKYTKEVNYDRFGNQIRTSSFEQVHGPGVEFDFNRPTVKISWNSLTLNLAQISTFIDTVNDSTLWGMPARCVKLSNCSFERRLYGVCNFYFNQAFEFDTDWNTFDRQVLDEGYKVLKGQWRQPSDTNADMLTWRNGIPLPTNSNWKLLPITGPGGTQIPPDRSNPQHFERYKDINGEMARVVLDGNGEPAPEGNPPVLWQANTYYPRGTFISNPTLWSGSTGNFTTNLYKCTATGISSSFGTGPSGTSLFPVVDGTCKWLYQSQTTGISNYGPGNIGVQYYPESNMLLLGIPSSLTSP